MQKNKNAIIPLAAGLSLIIGCTSPHVKKQPDSGVGLTGVDNQQSPDDISLQQMQADRLGFKLAGDRILRDESDVMRIMKQLQTEKSKIMPAGKFQINISSISIMPNEPARCEALVLPSGSQYTLEDAEIDVGNLNCLVGWMNAARDYLDRGGKPTQYTSPETFEKSKKSIGRLARRLSLWAAGIELKGSR
ncbi:MAG: hypothetical protein ACYCPQ_09010 [Elusimicrobiota bacterium]